LVLKRRKLLLRDEYQTAEKQVETTDGVRNYVGSASGMA
jgi:hypothetical protein